jgi:fumarate reductase subunit D
MADVLLPLGSWTVPGLSYQLLTATTHNNWTTAVLLLACLLGLLGSLHNAHHVRLSTISNSVLSSVHVCSTRSLLSKTQPTLLKVSSKPVLNFVIRKPPHASINMKCLCAATGLFISTKNKIFFALHSAGWITNPVFPLDSSRVITCHLLGSPVHISHIYCFTVKSIQELFMHHLLYLLMLLLLNGLHIMTKYLNL